MKQTKGFTLIELMITVAIIAILAAVAYPSYQEYLRKGRRVDAKTALLDAAQTMERYYTENNKYTDAVAGTTFPATSPEGHYTLSFSSNPTASTFAIQAAPTAGGKQSGDKCGTYTINNLGQQDVTGGTLSKSQCW